MVKLLGSILILAGGFWARWSMVSVCRRELDTLSELTACLSEMAEEIRQARTPLPELLPRQYMHNKENAVTMRLSAH